jgi:hypothetical protein
MQTLGTEWGRGLIHPDLWLLIAEKEVEAIHASGYHAAITDVRFENDAKFIREHGGVVWHIKRDSVTPVNAHVSEQGITFVKGDVLIDNNGSIDDLLDEVCDKF